MEGSWANCSAHYDIQAQLGQMMVHQNSMQLASNQSQLMLHKPESSFQVFNQCAPVAREHATASQGSRALIQSNNTSHRDSSLYILVSKPHSAAYTAYKLDATNRKA
jgi:hypothetical protein